MNLGNDYTQGMRNRNQKGMYLLPIAPVFCHHFPQCLQYFDAQPLLILLQQLLGVFDQSGWGKREKSEDILMSQSCSSPAT